MSEKVAVAGLIGEVNEFFVPQLETRISAASGAEAMQLNSILYAVDAFYRPVTDTSGLGKEVDKMLASSWSGDDSKLGREEELYVDSHGRPEGSDCPIFDKPSAYGEVTPSGARQLFDTMGVHTASDAVFADLGSGAGRLVVQAWLELPMVQRAIGVELAPSRHATAVSAWDSLVESGATAQFAHGRPICDNLLLLARHRSYHSKRSN